MLLGRKLLRSSLNPKVITLHFFCFLEVLIIKLFEAFSRKSKSIRNIHVSAFLTLIFHDAVPKSSCRRRASPFSTSSPRARFTNTAGNPLSTASSHFVTTFFHHTASVVKVSKCQTACKISQGPKNTPQAITS